MCDVARPGPASQRKAARGKPDALCSGGSSPVAVVYEAAVAVLADDDVIEDPDAQLARDLGVGSSARADARNSIADPGSLMPAILRHPTFHALMPAVLKLASSGRRMDSR